MVEYFDIQRENKRLPCDTDHGLTLFFCCSHRLVRTLVQGQGGWTALIAAYILLSCKHAISSSLSYDIAKVVTPYYQSNCF